MLARLLPLLGLAALLTGLAGPVRAAPAVLAPTGQMAAAPARATAQELKAAQQAVDAALKVRKQRFAGWQKAARARDAAAADVARRKRAGEGGAALESALKSALALDEEAARTRSALLAAEANVARGGAALLKLYDALLVERRRVVEGLAPHSPARAQAVTSYRELATQRDAVRQALLPVLREEREEQGAALPSGLDLDVAADDDVESLLEKADLARDLEARFLRQAEAVRRRIGELEEERAVARDVSGMVGRSQLFDEEDRRLLVVRTEAGAQPKGANGGTGDGGGRNGIDNDGARDGPALGADDGFLAPAPEGAADAAGPPPPAGGDASPTAPPTFSSPAVPSVLVRSEQGLSLPRTDAALAGVLASSETSVESLKALEQKLKAQAQALRDKARQLKGEARARGQ